MSKLEGKVTSSVPPQRPNQSLVAIPNAAGSVNRYFP
jgi:hypothetical protein